MSKNLLLALYLGLGMICQTELCAQVEADSVWGTSTFPRGEASERNGGTASSYHSRRNAGVGNGAGLGNTTRKSAADPGRDQAIVAAKSPARPARVGSVPRQPNKTIHAQPNMAVAADSVDKQSFAGEPRGEERDRGFTRPASFEESDEQEQVGQRAGESSESTPAAKRKPGALKLAAPTNAPAKATRSGSTTTSSNAIGSTLGSLAIVLGVFFAVSWLCRKLSPAASGPLPKEVLELLGRTSMGGRQQLQLLRLGNKLVLVAVTAAGMETISEVHDEAEVERLVQMCKRQQPGSVSGSFLDLVNQIEKTPILAGFVDRGKSKSTSGERGGV